MAAYNFVEQCRKDAGLPAFHRDVPKPKPGSKKAGVSLDEFAQFVGAVRNRSADLQAELQARDELLQRCADEKAKLVKEISRLGIKEAIDLAGDRVLNRAESLGLADDQCRQLSSAVKT